MVVATAVFFTFVVFSPLLGGQICREGYHSNGAAVIQQGNSFSLGIWPVPDRERAERMGQELYPLKKMGRRGNCSKMSLQIYTNRRRRKKKKREEGTFLSLFRGAKSPHFECAGDYETLLLPLILHRGRPLPPPPPPPALYISKTLL